MKRVLASIGIGNATVDTVLDRETVRPGESVPAEVHVEGGDAEQEVDAVEFELETRYLGDEGYEDATVERFRLDGFTVEPDASRSYGTTVDVPYHTPLTMGDASVHLETDLEVPMAVDPEDKDPLDVEPTDRMQAVFDAADELGLFFQAADVEADPHGRYVGRRYVQEFEFRTAGGSFAGELDEIELVFDPSPDQLTVYAEIDRRGGLLSEMAETDEHKTSFTLSSADDDVQRKLREAIEQHV